MNEKVQSLFFIINNNINQTWFLDQMLFYIWFSVNRTLNTEVFHVYATFLDLIY